MTTSEHYGAAEHNDLDRYTPEEREARAKARPFLGDSRLKFHFSAPGNVGEILTRGILAPAFAARIGKPLSPDLMHWESGEEPDAVSIADRDRNIGNPAKDDWWLRHFMRVRNRVGFILPSNLPVTEATPHVHESLVPEQIVPEAIEGMFIMEHGGLEIPLIERGPEMLVYMTETFLGIDHDAMLAMDSELRDHNARRHQLVHTGGAYGPGVTAAVNAMRKRKTQLAAAMLERFTGKPSTEVTELDGYIAYAKTRRIPLYVVCGGVEGGRIIGGEYHVAWPKKRT